jgi:cephalosporin hydroxylase
MIDTKKVNGSKNSGIRFFGLIAAIVVSLTIGFSAGKVWDSTWPRAASAFHKIFHKGYRLPEQPRLSEIADAFHMVFYHTQFESQWLGVPVQKFPMDQWVYQELLWDTRPDVLLEMGTFKGGSAYYFASMFDLIGHGRVITVDIERQPNLPVHPRISYLLGSSTSPEIVRQIEEQLKPRERVMVVLDSDHHAPHVLRELQIYSRMVSPGQYLVVEDTDINGHPVAGDSGPGPAEAVAQFLAVNHDFTPDKSREKFLVTAYPGGWLKRLR